MNVKISALQQLFLVENYNTYLNKQWASVEDVNSFYIMDTDIKGQVTPNEFGELIKGRFSSCLKCHQCYVSLWSCNIQLKKDDDVHVLSKIVKDINFSILPTSSDTREGLIK